MPTYSVRSILLWRPRADQTRKHIYEERITLWNAPTLEQAVDLAEREADEYAGDDAKRLGLLQGFWMYEDFKVHQQGTEVFSLLRESDLAPKAYLKAFFDTGLERESDYKGEPTAAPNRRPARQRSVPPPRRGGGR